MRLCRSFHLCAAEDAPSLRSASVSLTSSSSLRGAAAAGEAAGASDIALEEAAAAAEKTDVSLNSLAPDSGQLMISEPMNSSSRLLHTQRQQRRERGGRERRK